jgi:hypothetical protein
LLVKGHRTGYTRFDEKKRSTGRGGNLNQCSNRRPFTAYVWREKLGTRLQKRLSRITRLLGSVQQVLVCDNTEIVAVCLNRAGGFFVGLQTGGTNVQLQPMARTRGIYWVAGDQTRAGSSEEMGSTGGIDLIRIYTPAAFSRPTMEPAGAQLTMTKTNDKPPGGHPAADKKHMKAIGAQ